MQFVRPLAATLAAVAIALVPLAATATRSGDPAPAFSASRIDGKGGVDLSKLKGKAVYLNFFASWCGPCNDEAPGVETLYKKYHARGFLTVGVDSSEPPASGEAFAKKYGWTFASIADPDGAVTKAYGAFGLPAHVFIDRYGTISTYRLGEMSPGEIDAAINKIL